MATCALLWVAWYNGYPTTFPDTGSYLYTGKFFRALTPFRAPGYSMFTRAVSLGRSGWYIAVAQAVLAVYVVREACAYLIGGEPRFRDHCLLAIVCLLAALSSLPWEASLLMPDVFAGVMFLAAFLLAFNGTLRVAERIGLAVVLALAVSSHMSLLPIAVVFVAAVAIFRFAGWRPHGAPAPQTMAAWLLVPLAVAGLWTATLNREMGLGFRLSASGNEFLLARLFGDGIAADYLRANCPQKGFVACHYVDNLPRTQGEFLFYNPLLPALAGHRGEINEISRGAILAYPLRFAWSSFTETLRQLGSFRTGDETRTTAAPDTITGDIKIVFPGDLAGYRKSREYRDRIFPLARVLARVDTVVFVLSLIGCLGFARARGRKKLDAFLYVTMGFLVINAAVCATLAGVYDRYQSRVAWLIPFCLALYVCDLVRDKRKASSSSGSVIDSTGYVSATESVR